MRNLIDCIDKLRTTELGAERVRKNLGGDGEQDSIVAELFSFFVFTS